MSQRLQRRCFVEAAGAEQIIRGEHRIVVVVGWWPGRRSRRKGSSSRYALPGAAAGMMSARYLATAGLTME